MRKPANKTKEIKEWLEKGWSITQHQAKAHFNYERLASVINRFRNRGMWIINIGKPGKHAKYIMLEKGPIKNLMILGHRLEIIEAEYLPIIGSANLDYSDMDILIAADDGIKKKPFRCDSSAFRDKKIMEKHIKDLINKE